MGKIEKREPICRAFMPIFFCLVRLTAAIGDLDTSSSVTVA